MPMKGLSLRYKLLAALTVIPILGLSLFLLLAVSIFEKDKIAYIFDSSLSVSKTRAARVNSEIANTASMTQAVVLSYRSDTKNLSETGTYYFDREAKLQGFRLYAINSETGAQERTVDLVKEPGRGAFVEAEAKITQLLAQAKEKALIVARVPGDDERLLLVARFGEAKDPKHVVTVTLFEAAELVDAFLEKGQYVSYLARKDGTSLVGPEWKGEAGWGLMDVWAELAERNSSEGIAEISSPKKIRYLASFADVGAGDLVVVSMVNREAALKAIDVLLKKSVLFFVAVLSMTAIIAVLASKGLTSALSSLSFATRQIADGDFAARVDVKAGGEIGVLAKSFNTMAEEISRLMKETAEKARMESELATAKAVQETLFPENHATLGGVEISGSYMPASECGGDWWYYFQTGDKVFLLIADATGHGAPAALITSAARAVASVIQGVPGLSVSQALGILNRAICETSKGRMMMTFFLAGIDQTTGVMSYANASHEPPLLLKKKEGAPDRGDYLPLNDVNNPRLGEQPDCMFKEASVSLDPGDRLVFYTDGVVDVKNPEKKSWGERRFLKALSSHMADTLHTKPVVEGVVRQLHEFRSETPLDDDVTLVICSYQGAA